MTALAEKLKDVGADTIGAQLTTSCIEGLRLWSNNPQMAWDHAFRVFGQQFVRGLMADMAPAGEPVRRTQSLPLPPRASGHAEYTPVTVRHETKPYTPRLIDPARVERRQKMAEVIRSKYKNSAGVPWSDVGWHELPALARDGKEAAALLAAGPAFVPNDGRPVSVVLGVSLTDKIISNLRQD